ncbi:NACHT domain-containing protein [Streptomyces sp. NPDC058657]|uniref:NACHT domain-containing protein n=1 Tax=unclassified Streptomyces TaxID=2593676 RepID=UPI00365B1920
MAAPHLSASYDVAALTVAVLGESQGSGVLLAHRDSVLVARQHLVLTCAHTLGTLSLVRIARPGSPGTWSYRTVWRDDALDAALLVSVSQDTPATLSGVYRAAPPGGSVRLSVPETTDPLPGCQIVGFPDIQRYQGAKLDTDQFTGTVLPAAGLIRRELVFEFDRPPAAEREDGTSPLAGLSGAPVFSGSSLLGIVRSVPAGRHHRRLLCVPLRRIVESPPFRDAYAAATGRAVLLEPISGTCPEDPAFEREYALAVGAAYRKTRIFGLDELSKQDAEWDLDTAYLSLEAHSGAETARTPQRIDTLLSSRPRVLLRGDAGAGKTTLLWWLAAHAAAGTHRPELADLNGLVPYVVPLRTLRAQGRTFPTPAQLPAASRLMIDEAPDGWAGRVLKAGRALILVDGLDEVSQEDREDARDWLAGLLARYPDNRCVITSRPLAVAPDWLGSERFEELRLLPMRNGDIQSFVAAWHKAARFGGSDPHEDLTALERDLSHQFRQNPALADLARTPLLCAVICAVHRVRQGFLPETRWSLYQSALHMLLGNRDKRRRIGSPEGIDLTVEEHTQLLQRIAVWQVRGGQSEFTRLQAVRQVQPALAGMERIRRQADSDKILNHLVNRTGLLQERVDDFFQFTHRTFQDFLAAKEFVEGGHLPELLSHAEDSRWEDVVLLAAGHCNRRDMTELLRGLLKLGTRPVLTALCAQHATWLDEAVARDVRNLLCTVVPPAGPDHAAQLARLGPSVIGLLPAAGELSTSQAEYTVRMLGRIGGPEALGYAGEIARRAQEDVAQALVDTWAFFPTAGYARDVLARLAVLPYEIDVRTADRLAHLPLLPPEHLEVVTLRGTYEGRNLHALLAEVRRQRP